jgi:hypothetical protein
MSSDAGPSFLFKANGGAYIANEGGIREDSMDRPRRGAALAEGDRENYYGGGEKDYTDYPTLSAA